MVMSLVLLLLIYQPEDQLLPDTGCVVFTAFAADHFGADDLRPLVGHPLAAFTANHDLLRRPLVVPTERHLLNVVVLRDALDDSHRRLLSPGDFASPRSFLLTNSPYSHARHHAMLYEQV